MPVGLVERWWRHRHHEHNAGLGHRAHPRDRHPPGHRRAREVLSQFLVEAVTLAAFGELLGILLAFAASPVLAKVLQVPFVLNLGIIGLAFLFSAAVGILFDYFPARRAARLDPIEALRHE
jgi:ABC-type antimicrobial peptide transport system permease subunit